MLRELGHERTDADTEYRNAILICQKDKGGGQCRDSARKEYRDKKTDIQIRKNKANAQHKKNMADNRAECRRKDIILKPQKPRLDTLPPKETPPTEASVRKKLPPAWYYNPNPLNNPNDYQRIARDNTHIFIQGDNVYLFPRTFASGAEIYTLKPETIRGGTAPGQAGVTIRRAYGQYQPGNSPWVQENPGVPLQNLRTSPPPSRPEEGP